MGKIERHTRRIALERRFTAGRCCTYCGWSHPLALVAGSNPLSCIRCRRERRGQPPWDWHHVGGRLADGTGNPYGRLVKVNANVHRVLSEPQTDRPEDLRTPLVSPVELMTWWERMRAEGD